MALLIDSVIRRNLKESPYFTTPMPGRRPPAVATWGEGEDLVGWYVNPPPWQEDVLVFTDGAIYASGPSGEVRVGWSQVTDYETPKSKREVSGIRIRNPDGFAFIRIAGTHGPEGKFKDVFALTMILQSLLRSGSRAGPDE